MSETNNQPLRRDFTSKFEERQAAKPVIDLLIRNMESARDAVPEDSTEPQKLCVYAYTKPGDGSFCSLLYYQRPT